MPDITTKNEVGKIDCDDFEKGKVNQHYGTSRLKKKARLPWRENIAVLKASNGL